MEILSPLCLCYSFLSNIESPDSIFKVSSLLTTEDPVKTLSIPAWLYSSSHLFEVYEGWIFLWSFVLFVLTEDWGAKDADLPLALWFRICNLVILLFTEQHCSISPCTSSSWKSRCIYISSIQIIWVSST